MENNKQIKGIFKLIFKEYVDKDVVYNISEQFKELIGEEYVIAPVTPEYDFEIYEPNGKIKVSVKDVDSFPVENVKTFVNQLKEVLPNNEVEVEYIILEDVEIKKS